MSDNEVHHGPHKLSKEKANQSTKKNGEEMLSIIQKQEVSRMNKGTNRYLCGNG